MICYYLMHLTALLCITNMYSLDSYSQTIFWGTIQEELAYDCLNSKATTDSISWGRRGCKIGAALYFDLKQQHLGCVDV